MSGIFIKKHFSFVAALGLTVLMLLSASCSSDKKDFLPNFEKSSTVPTMYTDSVTTLISDSGRIRYRVITEVFKVFDKVSDPYWFFPKKVYFERFNDSLKVESLVQCDTARYFTNRKLWELKKNVKLISLNGEKFETALLYWDQYQQRIYSDSFVRIEKKGQIITGYGFESNQSLTKYHFSNGGATLPFDSEESQTTEKDTNAAK